MLRQRLKYYQAKQTEALYIDSHVLIAEERGLNIIADDGNIIDFLNPLQ